MKTHKLMKDATFSDTNGQHKLYKVRTLGRGHGFGIMNVLYNTYVMTGWKTRKDALDALQTASLGTDA